MSLYQYVSVGSQLVLQQAGLVECFVACCGVSPGLHVFGHK